LQNTSDAILRGEGIPDEKVRWPQGFHSGTIACGLKESGNPDLAILATSPIANAAGVFTRNQFKAAPVLVSQIHLDNAGHISGLVVNSGNANAGTGAEGLAAAREMTVELAKKIGSPPDQTLVMSTGVIGKKLPIEKVKQGIGQIPLNAGVDSVAAFARAMMTTDTQPKAAWVKTSAFHLVGVAKGSGMIHPDMATMLAVIATDAVLEPTQLKKALGHAVDCSFHRISVDGATSTNDAVVVLANGSSSISPNMLTFQEALNWICVSLARQIVADGEGASKIIEICIEKGRNERECVQVAKSIAASLLVKTAFFGEDPNWGRILAAAGQAGVELDLSQVDLFMGPIALISSGEPVSFSAPQLKQVMQSQNIRVKLVLNLGDSQAEVWSNDLGYRYVEINAEYTT